MRTILTTIAVAALVGVSLGAWMAKMAVGTADFPHGVTADNPAPGASTPPVEAKLPRLEIADTTYNFGKMQRGTERSHTFVLKNTGEAPLRIETGTPSCKCTVSDLETSTIAPGESVDLKMTWKAQTDVGPFRQWVPVTTTDPANSSLELAVEGEITELTGVVPSEFSFGKIRAGEQRSAEVYLMAYLQDEIAVHSAQIADEESRSHFDIDYEPVERDDLPDDNALAGVRFTVVARPSLPIGRFVQWLALETNLPETEQMEIPILGRVAGDISIAGRGWNDEQGTLRLGRVNSAEGKQAQLVIVVRGEESSDIEFEVAGTEPSELTAELGEPKRYKDTLYHVPLTIGIPPGTRSMARLNPNTHEPATVTLKTTHPQAPTLELGVRFAVQK